MHFPKAVGFLTLTMAGGLTASLFGQQAPVNWTAAEDHRNMMDQLGIKALRPGPSGTETAPNHANYDESTANPFPILPDVSDLEERQEGDHGGHVVESAPS